MRKICHHGISFLQQCDFCEMEDLDESLPKKERRLIKDKSRLKELQDKLDPRPDFLKQFDSSTDYDRSIHTNPDAKVWAEFFMKTKDEKNWSLDDIDESLMIGWFANAMMAMHDHIHNKLKVKPVTDDEIMEIIDSSELQPAHNFDRYEVAQLMKRLRDRIIGNIHE